MGGTNEWNPPPLTEEEIEKVRIAVKDRRTPHGIMSVPDDSAFSTLSQEVDTTSSQAKAVRRISRLAAARNRHQAMNLAVGKSGRIVPPIKQDVEKRIFSQMCITFKLVEVKKPKVTNTSVVSKWRRIMEKM